MTTKNASTQIKKIIGSSSFGGFLRSARTLKNMSQVEMAEYLGISKSTLCDIEKSRHIVSIELAAKIARQCGLSESLAIEFTIQDSINRAGLKYKVLVKKVAA